MKTLTLFNAYCLARTRIEIVRDLYDTTYSKPNFDAHEDAARRMARYTKLSYKLRAAIRARLEVQP